MNVEIIGTHFAITLGAWRLRFSLAVEDADLQHPAQPALPESPLRGASSEKFMRIYPNRR
ncbi:MAG: hypothetical protein ACREMP_04955 [Candidatus Tyrphobacter sp.]